ncbi:MAG: helix-turn-helix domain-containing protein [Chitinivibrionales bacterium]|nr:helix-turn-helix domain-containing protein [Chitinivibrionales bacterium]
MRLHLAAYLVAGVLGSVARAQPDRPHAAIVSPEPWAILSSNAVRVAVEAYDTSVASVCVTAVYRDFNRSFTPLRDTVGCDSTAPYELIWDCSRVLDQGGRNLRFFAHVRGNDESTTRLGPVFAVLDRNPDTSAARCAARYVDAPPPVGGGAADTTNWPARSGFTFENNDNAYRVWACWDHEKLYLALRVRDSRIIETRTHTAPGVLTDWDSTARYDDLPDLYRDDCCIFFFDADRSREFLIDTSDRALVIAPSGEALLFAFDPRSNVRYNRARDTRVTASTFAGEHGDTLGYFIAAAVSWGDIGMAPREQHVLGFDLYMVDRDGEERTIARWSGQPQVHHNPSEWGALELTRHNGVTLPAFLGLLALIGATGVAIGWRKRRGRRAAARLTAADNDPQAKLAARAMAVIEQRYASDSLDRGAVAAELKVAPAYLGAHFKRKTGMSIPAYINHIRIRQAEELLRESALSISEIALTVGYSSSDYFDRQFKKAHGMTPRQFRARGQASAGIGVGP